MDTGARAGGCDFGGAAGGSALAEGPGLLQPPGHAHLLEHALGLREQTAHPLGIAPALEQLRVPEQRNGLIRTGMLGFGGLKRLLEVGFDALQESSICSSSLAKRIVESLNDSGSLISIR